MKKNLIIMFLSILFLIVIVVIGMGPKGLYYKALYFGDRVKVKAKVLVDGKQVEVDKKSIKIEGKGVGKETVKINDNNLNVSFKGNQFSLYSIDFKAGDYTFRIGVTHYTWWDINKFDIEINVDTTKKTVSFKSKGKYLDEKTYKEMDFNIEDEGQIEDINVISVGIYKTLVE